MGKAIPVQIGGIHFAKKGDALSHIRKILNKYPFYTKLDLIDEEFLRCAIQNHPEYSEKVGAGIDYFEVRPAEYGTRCFWIIRCDGSSDDFSYKYCIP